MNFDEIVQIIAKYEGNEPDVYVYEYDENDKVLHIYHPIRGGSSYIVGEDNSFLFYASSVNPDVALKEFKSGKRSGNIDDLKNKV